MSVIMIKNQKFKMASNNSGESTSKSDDFYGAFKSGLCFICLENYSETASGSESENIIPKLPLSLSPEQQSVAAVSVLSKNDLAVYFTLKHIIELPEDHLKSYLQQCPHPDRWLKICSDCSETYAKKCKRIFMELLEVQVKFSGARLELIEAVKRSSKHNVRNEKSVVNTSWEIRDFIKHHDYRFSNDSTSITIGNSMISELLAAQNSNNELNVNTREEQRDKEIVDDGYSIDVNEKDRALSENTVEEEDNFTKNELVSGNQDDIIIEEFDKAGVSLKGQRKETRFYDTNSIHEEEEQDSNGNEGSSGHGLLSDSTSETQQSETGNGSDHKITDTEDVHSTVIESEELKNEQVSKMGCVSQQNEQTIFSSIVKEKYTCIKCKFQCLNSNELDEHMKSEHGNKQDSLELTCPTCRSVFSCRSDLVSHFENTHKAKTLHCELCDKYFTRSPVYNFQQHMFRIHGVGEGAPKPFTCAVEGCNKRFALISYLNDHAKCHLPKSDTCHICGKVYRLSYLKYHVKLHEKIKVIKKFPCILCRAKFEGKDELTTHVQNSHGKSEIIEVEDGPGYRSRCPLCQRTYKTWQMMKKHMRDYHKKEKVCCELCGMVLRNNNTLKLHKQYKHDNPVSFHCPRTGCRCSFRTEVKLQRHMLVHKDNGHKCDHCEKVFRTSEHLKKHTTAIHSENRVTKPFICELCGKRFASIHYLKYHTRHTHQEVKRKIIKKVSTTT